VQGSAIRKTGSEIDQFHEAMMLRCLLSPLGGIIVVAVLLTTGQTVYSQSVSQIDPNIPWQEISRIARDFVSRESPPSVWPFKRPSPSELARAPRKVFAHYFPFLVLSYENAPLDQDHWAQFLSRGGENGKWAHVGGYTRERPLTPGPWNSPYWREINAAIDILRAQLIGIDGFGIDLTRLYPGDKIDQANLLCEVAAVVAPGFHIVPEPDGDILKQASPEQMATTLKAIGDCPAAYHLPDGRLLVVPFAPNNEPVTYWHEVLARLETEGTRVAFIPDLLGLTKNAQPFAPISYGITFWGPRDPATARSSATLGAEAAAGALVSTWMHPIASQDSRPKSAIFWEAANTELFRALWGQAIIGTAKYAHIVTWNAYPEATQIEPSSGVQFLFYDLSAYYIDWFKTGKSDIIASDAIYYSHRTQIFDPVVLPLPNGQPFKNLGVTPVQNKIEVLAILTAPSNLEIEINGHRYSQNEPAGLRTFSIQAEPGRPSFRIIRDGKVIVEEHSAWEIQVHPQLANPEYFGGSSTREFVQVPKPSDVWR
jgi:Glycosyl hydrolase family 71